MPRVPRVGRRGIDGARLQQAELDEARQIGGVEIAERVRGQRERGARHARLRARPGAIAVGSLSDGEPPSLTTVASDASAAAGTAAGTASRGGEGVTPGRAGALGADACRSIKRR